MDLHAVLARCLGNTPGSTFLCCSISLQVYEAWETAEERQWRLQDGVSHLKSGSGYCRTVSLKQLKAPEERQGRLHEDPSLQCQWTAEDLERHGRPCRHYWLHLQNQSDVWGSIVTGFPPVAESPTPEVPCQLSHPPPPPHAPT